MFTTSRQLVKSSGRLKYSDYMTVNPVGSLYNANIEEDEFRVDRTFMTDAYKVNAYIRAIVDRTVDRFDQVELFPLPLNVKADVKSGNYPDKIKKQMELVYSFLMKPNYDGESFSSLKRKAATDIMIYDEGAIQINKGITVENNSIPFELTANVSGEEIYVNARKNGTLRSGKAFVQLRNGREIARWDKSEMMNFIRNRRAGYANGLSPIESIADAIIGDFEAMNYNNTFFANNARPNIAFLFNELGFGPGQSAIARAENWYYQKHKGKPHLPLFMGTQKGKVEIKELTVSNKDMEFSNWTLMLISRIMAVYGMQPMVLGILTDTTGKLNSEVQTEQYKRNAIIPLIKLFCNTFNSTFLWNDDNLNMDNIYLASANLDIDDEEKQSKIWEIFLNTGVVTINQVRSELRMPPVPWGNEPFVPLNYSPLSILEDWQKSRIEANMKNKLNNGGDDKQYNGKPAVKPAGKKPVVPAKKMIDDEEYMAKNFKLATGLNEIEPSEIISAFASILKKRESDRSTVTVLMNSSHNVAKGFGLEWDNIMKHR